MNPDIKRLEEKLQALKDYQRIDRLKREITRIEGDLTHPRSEGWAWDGDLGRWEQSKSPPRTY